MSTPSIGSSAPAAGLRRVPPACLLLACALPLLLSVAAGAVPGDQSWSADFYLPGLDREPHAYAEWNGMLAVGGEFRAVGPLLAGRIALFDGAGWQAAGEGLDGPVWDLVAWNGELVACGDFDQAGGVPAANVAAWDGAAWHALGDGVPDGVRAMAVFDGLLHCDRFRWNGATWDDVLQTDGVVRDFVAQDGLLVAGGAFTSAGGVATGHVLAWDGAAVVNARPGLAAAVVDLEVWEGRLFALREDEYPALSGSPVACWQDGAWTGTPDPPTVADWQGYHALALRDGELVLAGGWSFEIAGPAGGLLFHWDGSHWIDEEGQWGAWPTSLCAWNGSLVIGGRFAVWDGVAAAGLVRVTGASAEAMVTGGLAPSGEVLSLAAADSLAIGGEFAAVGHEPGSGFAVWNGAGWEPRSVSLLGELWSGGPIAWHDGLLNGIATMHSDYVDRCHVRWLSGGLSGGFRAPDANLFSCRERLLAVGATTVYDATSPQGWTSLASAAGGRIAGATVWNDRLVVYGTFTAIHGMPAAGLALLDGDQWQALAGPPTIAFPRAIAVWHDRLVAAGAGASGLRARVAVQEEDGWRVIADDVDGGIAALAAWGDQLFAGGWFRSLDGVEAVNIARWNGQAWHALGSGTDGGVNALAVSGGQLWVGGAFSRAGGRPAANLCTWFDPTVPVLVGALGAERLAAGGVRLTWQLGAAMDGEFVVERSSPDVALPAVTAAGRTRFELVDAGAPDGRLSYRLRHRAAGAAAGVVLAEAEVAARELPSAPWLLTPAPNPFNPAVTLRFGLARPGPARLAVYDLQGRRVAVLAEGDLAAGGHVATWRGEDARGRAQPSGVYLARIETAGTARTVKLVLAR